MADPIPERLQELREGVRSLYAVRQMFQSGAREHRERQIDVMLSSVRDMQTEVAELAAGIETLPSGRIDQRLAELHRLKLRVQGIADTVTAKETEARAELEDFRRTR